MKNLGYILAVTSDARFQDLGLSKQLDLLVLTGCSWEIKW